VPAQVFGKKSRAGVINFNRHTGGTQLASRRARWEGPHRECAAWRHCLQRIEKQASSDKFVFGLV
jgi:hypothetical protein